MLSELKVKNYALIKNLAFAPCSNFNVITGETGAGKSIILGALGLLLGDRTDNFTIVENEEKCVIEGVFDIKNYNLLTWFDENGFDFSEQLILRREISLNGRSRAFINDTPAQLNHLKELGKFLIDIHSQHQNLDLFQKSFQFKTIDSYSETLKIQDEYSKLYKEFKTCKKQLEVIIETEKRSIDERNFKMFLLEELESAKLKENENEILEEEYKALSFAEENLKTLSEIRNTLSDTEFATLEQLSSVKNMIKNISKNDSRFSEIAERIETVYFNLKDITSDIDRFSTQITIDPERLENINQRLVLLHNLSQKHRETDLIKVKEKLTDELEKYNTIDNEKYELTLKIEKLEKQCHKLAETMSEQRNKSKINLENTITKMINSLGMNGASLKIDLNLNENNELGNFGINDTNFLLSASKGKMYNPIQNIASGGEISRLMLVLKTIISQKNIMPTIIFDEIDTGISGETALKTAEMMKEISTLSQLIVITHLPQIAAAGNHHFFVFKEQQNGTTITDIKKLTKEERIDKIAEMIGGKNYSNTIFEGAKQLIG
ncbi:MAG: DNA repair protein RecN [Bacteroidetes bacterium]|nr:DNA repair protein RecN [Bacteroidota bacterium]